MCSGRKRVFNLKRCGSVVGLGDDLYEVSWAIFCRTFENTFKFDLYAFINLVGFGFLSLRERGNGENLNCFPTSGE